MKAPVVLVSVAFDSRYPGEISVSRVDRARWYSYSPTKVARFWRLLGRPSYIKITPTYMVYGWYLTSPDNLMTVKLHPDLAALSPQAQ